MTKLTQEELKRVIYYNPLTGEFKWLEARKKGSKIGDPVGWDDRGYRKTKVFNKGHRLHRLAWLYVYGKFPKSGIDHKNGNKNDNRIENLREADQSQNCANAKLYKNNSLGIKGIHKHGRKYRARIRKDGKMHYLGNYETTKEAQQAYIKAARKMFGEFARAS